MKNRLSYETYYRETFETYYASLVNFAHGYEVAVAVCEDIVQDVFLSVWNAGVRFDDSAQMRNYLYRATANGVYNWQRHRNVHEKWSREQTMPIDDSFLLDRIIENEMRVQVSQAIDSLPTRCREVCRLTLEGKRPAEIAKLLNLSVETIKKQKKIALDKLRDKLGILAYILFG